MNEIVGSPITRGQATEGINQLENAMKESGLDPQRAMTALIRNKAFNEMVSDFFLSAFENDPASCAAFPNDNEHLVAEYLKLMLRKNGGKFDFIDSEILVKFGQIIFAETETYGDIRILKKRMTQNEIMTEGKKLAIYKGYDIGEALRLAHNLATSKIVQEMGKTILIFLKEKYTLYIHKSSNEVIGLHLRSIKFHLTKFNIGDGVLFDI